MTGVQTCALPISWQSVCSTGRQEAEYGCTHTQHTLWWAGAHYWLSSGHLARLLGRPCLCVAGSSGLHRLWLRRSHSGERFEALQDRGRGRGLSRLGGGHEQARAWGNADCPGCFPERFCLPRYLARPALLAPLAQAGQWPLRCWVRVTVGMWGRGPVRQIGRASCRERVSSPV